MRKDAFDIFKLSCIAFYRLSLFLDLMEAMVHMATAYYSFIKKRELVDPKSEVWLDKAYYYVFNLSSFLERCKQTCASYKAKYNPISVIGGNFNFEELTTAWAKYSYRVGSIKPKNELLQRDDKIDMTGFSDIVKAYLNFVQQMTKFENNLDEIMYWFDFCDQAQTDDLKIKDSQEIDQLFLTHEKL